MTKVQGKWVVTETRRAFPYNPEIMEFAAESGATYTPRRDRSLARLLADEEADLVIVWEDEGPVLYQGEEEFFYHPSMGKNRVSRLRNGQSDPMVEAMDLRPGMEVLDCTLGLGSDALVASYVTGENGRVVGVDSSPLITAVVRWGIRKYAQGPVWLKQALERIEIICRDHLELLQELPDQSFDIVYFDPMFRHPIQASQPISPLRQLANHDPLNPRALAEAFRVCRRRVVVKERVRDDEFERLGLKRITGGKHSTIAFGILER